MPRILLKLLKVAILLTHVSGLTASEASLYSVSATSLPPLSTIWKRMVDHCKRHHYHQFKNSHDDRYIRWPSDGVIDISASATTSPKQWDKRSVPTVLRPYLLAVIDSSRQSGLVDNLPKKFSWMLRKHPKDGKLLNFHQDYDKAGDVVITTILYDSDGVSEGGEVVFALPKEGESCASYKQVDVPLRWLKSSHPRVLKKKPFNRAVVAPQTGDMVSFLNKELFHGVRPFRLNKKGARLLLTLFFYDEL